MTCKNISGVKIQCFVKPHVIIVAITSLPCTALAADLPVLLPASDVTVTDPISDYFLHWMDRANEAQESPPHWMTPITTVTPRLEQES